MSETFVSREEFEAFAQRTSELGAEIKSLIRTPSKAHLIGAGRSPFAEDDDDGRFLTAILGYHDPSTYQAAKATLDELRVHYDDMPSWSKATLGGTDATGGWLIPNAMVESVIKPGVAKNKFREMCTVVPGVSSAAVDMPFRSATPERAVIAAAGATKENVDLVYNGSVGPSL